MLRASVCLQESLRSEFVAEGEVAGVTETGDDVGILIEMIIDRGEVDIHVGMGHPDSLDALGGADQAHQTDVGAAALLEHAQGVAGAAAGREHRVGDDDETILDVLGEFAVIDHGLVGFFVTVQADMADLGDGHQLMQALYHTHTGAQDRDDRELASRDDPAFHRTDRSLDINFLTVRVGGDFVSYTAGYHLE